MSLWPAVSGGIPLRWGNFSFSEWWEIEAEIAQCMFLSSSSHEASTMTEKNLGHRHRGEFRSLVNGVTRLDRYRNKAIRGSSSRTGTFDREIDDPMVWTHPNPSEADIDKVSEDASWPSAAWGEGADRIWSDNSGVARGRSLRLESAAWPQRSGCRKSTNCCNRTELGTSCTASEFPKLLVTGEYWLWFYTSPGTFGATCSWKWFQTTWESECVREQPIVREVCKLGIGCGRNGHRKTQFWEVPDNAG